MALKSICVKGKLTNLSSFIAEENVNLRRGNWNIRLDCFALTSTTSDLKSSIKICTNLVHEVVYDSSTRMKHNSSTALAIENVNVTKGELSPIKHTKCANAFQVTNKLDEIVVKIYDLYSEEELTSDEFIGFFRFIFQRTE